MTRSPAAIAAALAEGRAAATPVAVAPDEIPNVAAAYAVQEELIRLGGGEVPGWKVTALAASDQAKLGADTPLGGPMLAPWFHRSPATLRLSTFQVPLLECEVAFRLGADLPPRDGGYTMDEVAAAVAAIVPVYEIADGRVPPDSPALLKLADSMNSGGLIVGPDVTDWRGLDRGAIPIALTRDGAPVGAGSSARILGDPLKALVALANARPLPGPGLRAGQVVTTGTCTDPVPIGEGDWVASFAGLGEVRVRFVA